jgi:hypothetical protein
MAETIVIPESERQALRSLVKANGHRRTAKMLEISFDTLVRALAECGVHRSTVALIRLKLAAPPPEVTP